MLYQIEYSFPNRSGSVAQHYKSRARTYLSPMNAITAIDRQIIDMTHPI